MNYEGTWKHNQTNEIYSTESVTSHQVGWPKERQIEVFSNRKDEPYRQSWSLRHWKHWVKDAIRIRDTHD